MGLHGGMLDPLQVARDLRDVVRRGQSGGHVPGAAVQAGDDVAAGVGDAAAGLVVQDGRAGLHGSGGVEHGRQDLVLHEQRAAAGLGGGFGLRGHGGHTLADEAHHVVQQAGVVRVGAEVLVPGSGVEPGRRVLMREHRHHAGDGHGGGAVNRPDAGVGVWGAQQPHVQQGRQMHVQGVARGPGDDRRHIGRRIVAGLRADVMHRCQGVPDGAVVGVAAQVAFHGPRQVVALRRGQRAGGQDHAGSAEPTLEALCAHEGAL